MKKLFVLMLVLGMVSLAGAAVLDTLTDRNVRWDVLSDGHLIGTGLSLGDYEATIADPTSAIVPDPTLTPPGIWPIAGDAGEIQGFGGSWNVYTDGFPQELGEWFRFDIVATTPTDLYFYDSAFDPVGTITVPEPMSVVLLGLGGLFLRRRK